MFGECSSQRRALTVGMAFRAHNFADTDRFQQEELLARMLCPWVCLNATLRRGGVPRLQREWELAHDCHGLELEEVPEGVQTMSDLLAQVRL